MATQKSGATKNAVLPLSLIRTDDRNYFGEILSVGTGVFDL